MSLTTDEAALFNDLIVAAGQLATVADQASTVLSAEFEGMCRPSIENVRAILARCPVPEERIYDGDGLLREEDCTVTARKRRGDSYGQNNAVHIIHRPTGLGMESDSKPTFEENRAVAIKALTARVQRELKKQ